jgi:hypothetical protein
MRFSDLKIGDHFFFEGHEYTKTSPVLACDVEGKSRIIPRSAELQSHSTQGPLTTDVEDSELDRLYHAVTTIIRQEVHDSDLEVRLRHAIEKAWKGIKQVTD